MVEFFPPSVIASSTDCSRSSIRQSLLSNDENLFLVPISFLVLSMFLACNLFFLSFALCSLQPRGSKPHPLRVHTDSQSRITFTSHTFTLYMSVYHHIRLDCGANSFWRVAFFHASVVCDRIMRTLF